MPKTQSMRLILVADTHLGLDYPLRPRTERCRRGQDFFDNFIRVLDFAVATRADLLVHGGDLFFRSRIPPKISDLVYALLLEYAEKGLQFVIVPGNHERSQLPQSLLTGHPNIRIFDQPQTFALNLNGIKVAISGFPNERQDVRRTFPDLLQRTKWQQTQADIRLLCFHQAVDGAQVGPAIFTFRTGHDVIRLQDLPADFTALLAGHIHRRQILKRAAVNPQRVVPVIYPGSVERTSFAEKNEPKGFFEILFAPNESDTWQIENLNFQPLPARPMREVVINTEFSASHFQEQLSRQLSSLETNAIVRLKPGPGVSAEVKKLCTSRILREILPATLIIELSREFFPER